MKELFSTLVQFPCRTALSGRKFLAPRYFELKKHICWAKLNRNGISNLLWVGKITVVWHWLVVSGGKRSKSKSLWNKLFTSLDDVFLRLYLFMIHHLICYMWFKWMQISLSRMCELWEKFVTGSSNVARELSFAAKSLLANLSSENGSFSEIVCIHNTRWFPTWDWNVRKFIPRRCRHTTSCEKYCKPPFDSSKSPSKFYERISPVSCWWREIFIDFSFHRSRSQTTITTALSIAKVQSSRFNQLYTERVVYAHSLISIM